MVKNIRAYNRRLPSDENVRKRLTEWATKKRLAQHLSQEVLANEAEIPISQIDRCRDGEVNPTLSTINALAHALKSSMKKIMDFSA